MKKLLLSLIATVISFTLAAQTRCLPDSIISKITDELIIKDHWEQKLHLQDSLLITYESQSELNYRLISVLEAKNKEQEIIIDNKNTLLTVTAAEKQDLKKTNRKLKIKNAVLAGGISLEAIGLIVLLIVLL